MESWSWVSLDQKRARWFGVLYLITFITSIPALALYEAPLRHPTSYITGGGHDKQVLFGALLELLLIVANVGTAVVIVPIAAGTAAVRSTKARTAASSASLATISGTIFFPADGRRGDR